MPYVEEPCTDCAGGGWKKCPNCPGTGLVRCSQNCQSGKIRCPAGCNNGYQTSGSCDFCHGTLLVDGRRCNACDDQGHMRCGTCNPFKLGGGLPSDLGYLRCPNECNAGYFPCPVCTLYKWGAGMIGCATCGEDGTIAVWHEDPVVVAVAAQEPPPPTYGEGGDGEIGRASCRERV